MKPHNEISLDDFMYWFYTEHPKLKKKVNSLCTVLLIFITMFFGSVVCEFFGSSFELFVFSCISLFGIVVSSPLFAVYEFKRFNKSWRMLDELSRRTDGYPHWKMELAKELEPDYVKRMLWLIECEESHINGECPLCGAE